MKTKKSKDLIRFVDLDNRERPYDDLPAPQSCPFCGCNNRIWLSREERGDGRTNWHTQCVRCHSCGPFQLDALEAVNSWNTRFARAHRAPCG